MRKTLTRAAVVLALLAGLAGTSVAAAPPAHAAGVVYVDMQVPGRWWGATQYGVAYTDRFTASRVVWGRCPFDGSRCVIIRAKFHAYDQVAVATWSNSPVSYIDVNPLDTWYTFGSLANTMAHEYAHAIKAITWHTSYRWNVMYYRLPRGWGWTAYQRSVLARY